MNLSEDIKIQNILSIDFDWVESLKDMEELIVYINKNNSEHNKNLDLRNNLKNFNFYNFLSDIPNLNFDTYFFCCSPEYSNQFSNTAYEIIRKIYDIK